METIGAVRALIGRLGFAVLWRLALVWLFRPEQAWSDNGSVSVAEAAAKLHKDQRQKESWLPLLCFVYLPILSWCSQFYLPLGSVKFPCSVKQRESPKPKPETPVLKGLGKLPGSGSSILLYKIDITKSSCYAISYYIILHYAWVGARKQPQ